MIAAAGGAMPWLFGQFIAKGFAGISPHDNGPVTIIHAAAAARSGWRKDAIRFGGTRPHYANAQNDCRTTRLAFGTGARTVLAGPDPAICHDRVPA